MIRALAMALALFAFVSVSVAVDRPVSSEPRSTPTAIPYKTEAAVSSGDALRVIGVLVVLSLIAYGFLFALKRYAGTRLTGGDNSRIKLLETRRISTKTTLFAIDYDGKRLLLGQCGDRLVTIHSEPAAPGSSQSAS